MMAMDSYSGGDLESRYRSRTSRDSDRDSDEIRFRDVSNTIISKAPQERFQLGYFSVISLVINRMIGILPTVWVNRLYLCILTW
jgi:hypothetical protein